jgi:hypothetical protein
MLAAIATVLLTLAISAPTDIKGKWDGTVTSQAEDGSTRTDTALLILDQKDTTVTGSIGGSEADQIPIATGTIEGNKVTLTATSGSGREFRLELTVENDEMKGTVTAGGRRGQVVARKRKD